ncbi:kinase-like domain-containing protein [Rhizophagus irregularis DAOM 181602=DAOM 197198]|nr:kinase-like domain-containing protein [Rhizophagus irregularis DAOM 181602=DAOM 197198]
MFNVNNTELKIIDNSNEWINWIEESIVNKQIKYYDYKHFNNIQEIGVESFGNVYRANLKNSHGYIILKSFINFNIIAKEIVNELKLQREVDFHENIIHFYGISTENQSDDSKKYLLVMEYADSGTLRNYLSERFENLTWNDKLNLALQLSNAISWLHNKKIVHRDLHSNSILVHRNIIKLADFGLSIRVEESTNIQSNLSKMFAYVDPQNFNIKSHSNNQIQVYSLNQKSDIYSIGILFWEISSGQPPFRNESYNDDLVIEILQGLREKPIPNTPEDYVNIYTDCWNIEPNNRPTINQVVEKLNAIIKKESTNLSNLSNEQQNIFEIPNKTINKSLHIESMSQIIQNFNRINIKEIGPLISSNLNVNDFQLMVNEIIHLLENVEYLIILGKGMGISIDRQKAYELCQEAANLGIPRGINNLGTCYLNGFGTNVNYQKAVELYQAAANLGSVFGINNLGYCYEKGIGTNVNYQKAFELYAKAANLGYFLSQYNLAKMYDNGIGIEENINQAIYWYKKSAEQGNDDAKIKLNELITNEM